MTQCPICNEPIETTAVRADLISSGMSVVGMCRGEASMGEVQVIEMERTHARTTEGGMGGCQAAGLVAPPK